MSQDAVKERPGGLTYPFNAIEAGETVEIADGVIWARLAVPDTSAEDGGDACDHVNIYVLRDVDGWTLIDTGPSGDAVQDQLAWLIEKELKGEPLTRVICTHMSKRHLGQAGWLRTRYGAELWMSRMEYLSARVRAEERAPPPPETIEFLRAAGWQAGWIESFTEGYGAYGHALKDLPRAFTRIEDRDDLRIGARTWRVLTSAGPSPEQICMWQPELRLFISGGHVTPRTAPSVEVSPLEPAADPLNDWILSCWRIMAAIPDDVLVLPGRDTPFHGLHARLDDLIEAAAPLLARIASGLDRPRRAADLMRAVLVREPRKADRMPATGAALACLNYLKRKGRVRYRIDADGVAWFERDPAGRTIEDVAL